MKKQKEVPIIDNILRLFSKRLNDFSGESKRSYQKAFSSLQIYTISHYSTSHIFDKGVVFNWIVDNLLQGLSYKTVAFYLDKISSLYTRIANRLEGGREVDFKEIKNKLRELPSSTDYAPEIVRTAGGLSALAMKSKAENKSNPLVDQILSYPIEDTANVKESVKRIWAATALNAGIPSDVVKGIIGETGSNLKILNLCEAKPLTTDEKKEVIKKVGESLFGEPIQWFAMKLRPKVNFTSLMARFTQIADEIQLPEIFYPMEEIAGMVGRKIVWKGRPVIRDVVFFKSRKSDIYSLFTKIYDIAWCFRTPGQGVGNYAVIPDRAMEDFRNALGILSPDFEVAPAGEMQLRPGDKVIILNGEYAREEAKILKESKDKADGHKVFRVTLLNSHGHWDIGIDARLLKKVETKN